MKINSEPLKLFKTEAELVDYLKVNGITGGAQAEHVSAWKKGESKPKAKPKSSTINTLKKTRMVVTETDESVELK